MNSRRQFFKQLASFAGIAVLASVFSGQVMGDEKRRARGGGDGDLPMAVPGKEVAGTLGYMEKTKDPAKHCSNCQLFTKTGNKGGGEVGKCQVLVGKLVKGEGYCNSWAKKA